MTAAGGFAAAPAKPDVRSGGKSHGRPDHECRRRCAASRLLDRAGRASRPCRRALCGWSRARSGPRTALGAAIGLLCMGLWATAALPEIVTTFLFSCTRDPHRRRAATGGVLGLCRVRFLAGCSPAWWSGSPSRAPDLPPASRRPWPGRCPAPIRPSSAAPWRSAMRSLCHAVQHGRIALLMPIMLALCDRIAWHRPGGAHRRRAGCGVRHLPALRLHPAGERAQPRDDGCCRAALWPALRLSALSHPACPVIGIGKGVGAGAAHHAALSRSSGALRRRAEAPAHALERGGERRLAGLLALTLLLWMTDSCTTSLASWIGIGAPPCA